MSRKIRRGRGSAGLGPGRRPRRRSSSKGSGSCSMAIPRAIAATAVVLAQLAAVKFWMRRAT